MACSSQYRMVRCFMVNDGAERYLPRKIAEKLEKQGKLKIDEKEKKK